MHIATPKWLPRPQSDRVGMSYKNRWRFDVFLTPTKTPRKYMRNHTRATIYFSADIFKALRMKAAATHRSISEMVNEAVTDALAEDAIDLDAFTLLRDEPVISFDSFVCGLRRRGKL
jgi:hypothetical protein